MTQSPPTEVDAQCVLLRQGMDFPFNQLTPLKFALRAAYTHSHSYVHTKRKFHCPSLTGLTAVRLSGNVVGFGAFGLHFVWYPVLIASYSGQVFARDVLYLVPTMSGSLCMT
ncbi:hypothetical protein VPNG_10326 [Cytospora leucostoma]|uniref:Uncharacterized protein n=1 Tax=Cytospora leucostoma TaxID=1230097 RepID=A0A423VBP9_9PEZI|nr:hypothetical protein VPNG_10326 [Cytospora leucostoma]